jgi:hypothetical protein
MMQDERSRRLGRPIRLVESLRKAIRSRCKRMGWLVEKDCEAANFSHALI